MSEYTVCAVCGTILNIHKERRVDGKPMYLCTHCRKYMIGMLRGCGTCSEKRDCPRKIVFDNASEYVCENWKKEKEL